MTVREKAFVKHANGHPAITCGALRAVKLPGEGEEPAVAALPFAL